MLRFETSNGDANHTRTAAPDPGRIPDGQFAHVAVVADRAAGSVILGRMGDLFPWRGVLDQVENACAARSAAWIDTALRKQPSGSTFLTLGEQESDPN